MKTRSTLSIIALALAACGGGSDDSAAPPPVAATPAPPPAVVDTPKPAPTPAAPQPAPQPAPAPTPVPVVPAPETPAVPPPPTAPTAPPPVGTPPPPPPPPEPAPGTFVPGKLLRAALAENPSNSWERPIFRGGDPDKEPPAIVNYWVGPSAMYHESYPRHWSYVDQFPQATHRWSVVYPDGQTFSLDRQMGTYTSNSTKSGETALIRADGAFSIRDEAKYLLNTSIATWRGVEGAPWFVQLQVATMAGAPAVFKVCVHSLLPLVRRLSCTLHDKDTGQYRGAQLIDDSDGLGPIEYRPPTR